MLGLGIGGGGGGSSFSSTGNAGVGAVGLGGAGVSTVRNSDGSGSRLNGSETNRSATTVGGAAGAGGFCGSIGGGCATTVLYACSGGNGSGFVFSPWIIGSTACCSGTVLRSGGVFGAGAA